MNPTESENTLVAAEPEVALPVPRLSRGARGRLAIPLVQAAVVVIVGSFIVSVYARQYVGGVFILALTYAIVTVGMAVQIGYSQQVAFSQAVFMGGGAYGVALLNSKVGMPSFFASLLVTIGGGIVAALVGSVVCKARGLALPVATIMFPLIAGGFVGGWNFLGGTIGLPLTGNLWPWGGTRELAVGNGLIVVVFVALAVFFASRLLSSQVGLELFILGVNEATAGAMGVLTARRKLELFVFGSTLATLGGALYAGSQLFVPQTLVTAPAQLALLLMLFIGGRRSVLGAVVGAFAIQYLSGVNNFISVHILLLEGAAVTIILLIEPEGLAGIAATLRRRLPALLGSRVRPGAALSTVPAGGGAAPAGGGAVAAGSDAVPAGDEAVHAGGGGGPVGEEPVSLAGQAPVSTFGRGDRWNQGDDDGRLLLVEDLFKSFGGLQVLDQINLSLPSNGIFGLCGPNGAGKSTLLNIVGGSIPASSGRVLLGGTDVTNKPADQHFDLGVSRTFQAIHLVPGRTALENVAVACLNSHHRTLALGVVDGGMPVALERAEAALEFLGLQELRDREVTSLTLEGQRMVELARAIAPQPRLLLLDEPASGLSEAQRDALKSTLRTVSTITSILLVEHDLDLVAEVAQKIFVLVTGRVLFEGTGQEFYSSEVVQSVLIGSSSRSRRRKTTLGEGRPR